VPPAQANLKQVMVRRLKDDLREVSGGFPKREIIQRDIDGLPPGAPELRLADLLDQYRRLREERLSAESKRARAASGLLICGLQQRLLSSIEAFVGTLRVHRRTVKRQWEQGQQASAAMSKGRLDADLIRGSIGSDDDRASLTPEDLALEEEDAIETATMASTAVNGAESARQSFAEEQKLLDGMSEIAEASKALPDARIKELFRWMAKHMCPNLGTPGAQWNNTRVLVFTEYDDTRRYLQQQLNGAIAGSDQAERRIAIFHGPTPAKDREKIKLAFNADPAKHPVRILIATDAAREGLNLQAHCWNVFHFDVPWNPSRMEQRNGRVDRKLQPNPIVYCHYFFYRQRPEDQVLAALVRKTRTIREELGSLAQVIDSRLDKLMAQGIRRNDIGRLEHEIETADLESEQRATVEQELEAARERQVELREQIDRLRTMLQKSSDAIAFSKDHFRSAISCALRILEADPLKVAQHGDGGLQFTFPAIDRRPGADPSWAETMDSLRAPRESEQSFWEWRKSSPIRPVVFEDPGKVTDEVVQLHLEQRVVQRLLSRFTAQGFVHHDLSRACMAQTTDAIPRVLLLGRLALYGPGAARLHEELVPVTARWIDPQVRKDKLGIYGRETEAHTLRLLDSALGEKPVSPVPDVVVRQLQQAAPRDVQELLPELERRAEEYAVIAAAQLEKRADFEAKAMQSILETQQKHLEETIRGHEYKKQYELFAEEERRQVESNRRYWGDRLVALREELKTEPGRIRSIYKVSARRIEPVGLVYLWPVTR
jgi:hypothetical protein